MTATCVLYLPWLCEQLQRDDTPASIDLPELLQLLSRADRRTVSSISNLHQLTSLLGLGFASEKDVPIATARLKQKQTPITDAVWCADPVFMQVDRDRAIVMPPAFIQITHEEADALIASLNAHFHADGLRFEAVTPQAWVLHSAHTYAWQTTAMTEAIGQDARAVAVRGADAQLWRRWQNEIEMVLFSHPVNQQREEQEQWPITGVWLWGGGTWSSTLTTLTARCYCDDIDVQTLAQAAGITTDKLPMNLHRVDWQAEQQYIFTLLQPLSRDQLIQFDLHWLAPLRQAVQRGQLKQVQLLTRQWQFEINAKQYRRWWRRRHTLLNWCT